MDDQSVAYQLYVGIDIAAATFTAAWAVVAANLIWVVGSIVAVAAGRLLLTAPGTAFVLAQAAAVALFAALQFLGVRRTRLAEG